MIDEDIRRREEILRAEKARALLTDPLISEAFATLEDEYVTSWITSPVRDAEARETIWRHLQALRKVHAHLNSVVTTGTMARQQLRELTGLDRPEEP